MKKDTRYDHCCYCCEYSSALSSDDNFLCRKKGVVPAEFACSSFIFDPLKKEVSLKLLKSDIDPEELKI